MIVNKILLRFHFDLVTLLLSLKRPYHDAHDLCNVASTQCRLRSPNEKSKSRLTFPYDLECPIIVCTQSYTDSYEPRMVRRGCLSDTDSKVRPVTFGKTVDFVQSDYCRDYVVTDYVVSDQNHYNVLFSGRCPVERT